MRACAATTVTAAVVHSPTRDGCVVRPPPSPLCLHSDVVTARNNANEPAVHSLESEYHEVIPALEGQVAHVMSLLEKANKYMRYQEILRLPVRLRCPLAAVVHGLLSQW